MPRKKIEGICSVDGCTKSLFKSRFYCHAHYMMNYKYGRTTKLYKGDTRKNKFYPLWHDRKVEGLLCEEWAKDFRAFEKDISPRPEGNYFLIRLRNEPFGPTNFKWQEHLKRQEGESKKDWYARKWAHRQHQFPGIERARSLKRRFGMTAAEYNEILRVQNNVCAICKKEETAIDGKAGTKKRLAVDHCHNSNKIRGLLCWRCNASLGKINDDTNLLQAMIDYLNKHKV